MKIALVSFEFPPDNGKGGIGTYTFNVANLLVSYGFVVHVFAASFERQVSLVIDNVYVHWIKSSDAMQFRSDVVPVFSQVHAIVNFDLLESAEINGNGWFIKAKFPDLKLIVRLHAPNYLVEYTKQYYFPKTKKLRYVIGSMLRGKLDLGYWKKYHRDTDPDYRFALLADYVTAPSQWMANWAIDNWKISQRNLIVFPNPFFPNLSLLEIPIAENHPYRSIVFYGRLNVLKGLVNLTYAMKVILNNYPNWSWKIIGDDGPGPMADGKSMKTWIMNQMGSLLPRIEFIQGVSYDQLAYQLEKSEIMIIPSLFESFSYVCKEGMAAGKAIIGSNIGGIGDLIKDGYTGLLFNPYNKVEITEKLKMVIEDAELCSFISKNARNVILNDMGSEAIFQFYNEFSERKG